MKIIKIVIPIVMASVLVGAAVKLVKLRKAEEAKMHSALIYPIVVKTYKPQTKDLTLSLPYLALVKNSNEVIINSKFAGRILYIKNLGDKVKKGEVVARIDNSDLKAKLNEVNENINSLKDKLDSQKIALNNLLATHQRTAKLLKVKMASIEQFQNEESKIAELNAQIKATQNSIKSLKSNRASILQNLTYTVLKSPINGTVSQKFMNKTDIAFPGKPLMKISSDKGSYIFLTLPKAAKYIVYNSRLYPLIPLDSTFEGLKTYKAVVNDRSLINGEKVNVNVVEFKGKATALPYNAILSINKKNYVFIPEGNKAKVKQVHIVAQGEHLVAVKEQINSPVITAEPDILLKIKGGHIIKVEN